MRVGFFDNFDSRPPEGFQNDYGWTNTFGFKF